jgi:hypothetical protein
VKKENQPVSEAVITLIPQSSGGDWASGGVTDRSGTAVIKTTCGTYQENGVPEGNYKVMIIRRPDIQGEKSEAEVEAMPGLERDAYFAALEIKRSRLPPVVPEIWGNVVKTPLAVRIDAQNNQFDFDAGKNN